MKRPVILFLSIVFLSTVKGFCQTLKETANQKIEDLQALIENAEEAGFDVLREKLAIRTSEVFLKYADWDEDNIQKNTDHFKAGWHYRDNAAETAELLADFEREDVIKLLDASIATLNKVIDGEIIRKATPNVDWENVTHDGDQLTHEGRPVFLGDWTWKPQTDELNEFHGWLDDTFITPGYVINEAGDMVGWRKDQIETKNNKNTGFVFVNNRGIPQWAKDKYGAGFEIKDPKGVRYTEYDIDHPGAKEMMGALVNGFMRTMSGKEYTGLGYMMCNEPHFIHTKKENGDLTWASSGVSPLTIDSFKVWLERKHEIIADLNTIWNTSFQSFDEVSFDVPVSLGLRGTPQWYDWSTFNMNRVTNWYQWLADTIKGADPHGKVHLKLIPSQWYGNARDHGLNFEALTRLSDIIGNDTGATHRSYPWSTEHWEANYIFDWGEMAMAHDFFKSVSPKKIMFNSEAHYLSTHSALNLQLNPMHSRATYWLAHTQGMNASQTWYWSRREDGDARNQKDLGYGASNNHQPRVTNEVHNTLMDLNAYAEEITAFQRQRKPIRLFYSETSAINKENYMDDVFELYESLYFEGIPLGFVTKGILQTEQESDWDVVLVHKTEYVTKDELAALQAYVNAGGKVIIDNESLKMDEYGRSIGGLTGNTISANGAANIKNKAINIVEGAGNGPEVTLVENSSVNYPICTWKSIENAEGNQVMSIVNVGKVVAEVTVRLKNPQEGTTSRDLIDGIDIPTTRELKPREVLFIELRDEKSVVLGVEKEEDAKHINIFPNPSDGLVYMRFEEPTNKIEVKVTDINGRLVLDSAFINSNNAKIDIRSNPSGIYIVQVRTPNRFRTFKLLRR